MFTGQQMPRRKPVWKPGDPPTSTLARKIINAYYNDIFLLPIVYGEPRIGKSVYVLKVLFQVYDFIWGWDMYRVYEECLGFKPDEVIMDWRRFGRKMPAYCWDDAGCWLFTLDYHDPLLKEIQRYFNVLSTDIQCLFLTTPDPTWILSKIGKMPGSKWIKVIRVYGDDKHLGPWTDSIRYSRRALTYTPWRAPDLKKTGVSKPWIQDDFSCKLPDELYEYYKPKREFYANLVKERMWEAMNNRINTDKVKANRLKEQIENLTPGVRDV